MTPVLGHASGVMSTSPRWIASLLVPRRFTATRWVGPIRATESF